MKTPSLRGIHLHDQGLVLVFLLLSKFALEEHEIGGPAVDEDGEASEAVAPGRIVVVGVHQPVAIPATPTEDGHAEEEEDGGDAVTEEVATDQLDLKLKDPG